MTELEKKIEAMIQLSKEASEAERVLKMKNGLMDDLMKELLIEHLGYPKDMTKIPFGEILEKVYLAGKRA